MSLPLGKCCNGAYEDIDEWMMAAITRDDQVIITSLNNVIKATYWVERELLLNCIVFCRFRVHRCLQKDQERSVIGRTLRKADRMGRGTRRALLADGQFLG